MAYTLNALQVPVPLGPTAQYLLSSAATSSGNAPECPRIAAGDTTALLTKLNEFATRIDIGATYAPMFGIMNGLVISVSSGLTLAVSAGQANIYGVAELAASTLVLPNATADIFVWLKSEISGGVVTVALTYTTTTTPPTTSPTTGTCVYLGHAVTSGGAITAIDLSGVVYLNNGGMPVRYTADIACPTDTPSANTCFITDCPAGAFLWDGTRYTRLAQAGTLTVTANHSATVAEQRKRTIKATGAGGYTLTVTIAEAEWLVRNASAGSLGIYDGTTTITVATGKTALVGCDATGVFRMTADV
jgi:hypothetical protein